MWANMLLSPYLHPKLSSLGTELYKSPLLNVECTLVYIPSLVGGAYVWAAVLRKKQLSNAWQGCALHPRGGLSKKFSNWNT